MLTFQQLILTLQSYWGAKGCALLQPYDMEMGAGTFHTATFLRAIGPEPWKAAYVQPSRRPKDGRYGDNPNRLQHYYQYQVVLKPSPDDLQDLYLGSLKALGIDARKNDIRFVEDDWESPTLGAWGLGWEVWLNGMEVTQFTYFQQVGGLECKPVLGELTYGLERLAMYLQEKESVFDLVWVDGITYGDVYHQNEVEQSKYNFEASDAVWLLSQFNDYETQAKRLIEAGLPLPGYEMVLKCSHAFNLLDARGAISVTERAAYIGRVRTLARLVAKAYYDSREKLGFPMLKPLEAAAKKARASAMAKGKLAKARKAESLLVELLTEELPPKVLHHLAEGFCNRLAVALKSAYLSADAGHSFASPRRLAVLFRGVLGKAPDSARETLGPPVNAGLEAAKGFARKCGISVESLTKHQSAKGEVWFARYTVPGTRLDDVLAQSVDAALRTLPIPKLMRWGDGDAQFARPVHGLLMMHGRRVVSGTVLGATSGNATLGHRFMSSGSIRLNHADEYEAKLHKRGLVIADFAARKSEIDRQLQAEARRQKAGMGEYQDLLDEVTALVEFPTVYTGTFDESFLEVPQECLVLTMRQNQKYFPLFASGKLLPKFLIVSNLRVKDPGPIVRGNERVVRPRLEDARFFFNQDRKLRLEVRVPQLAKVVYHNKLGNQRERVDRLKLLAGSIARGLGADSGLARLAEQAAELSKADLLTGMVGEFPELQGVMGRYYALHDGEPAVVADAIEGHYRPRFAGDRLPEGTVACSVALADKLDTLAGLFSIGEQPTGDKDPFGLRRAALGVIRILVENRLSLSLSDLVDAGFKPFESQVQRDRLWLFFVERMRGYFLERGYSANEVEAVLSVSQGAASPISLIPKQLEAVRAFSVLPEAASLAAANKRIANILRQAESKGESFFGADVSALKEPAEIALFEALQAASRSAKPLFDSGDFAGYLKTFASLKSPVDSFFDTVMVMADDKKLRENRLALLTDMRKAMNRFSDISKLAA